MPKPRIDARALARIAGVGVGTLNVWIARDLVPGVDTGTQGRARLFDLDSAIHIAIMTALVRQGYAAPGASDVAFSLRQGGWDRRGKVLIVRTGASQGHLFTSQEAPSLTALERELEHRAVKPDVFTIVAIDDIFERVRKAFMQSASLQKSDHQT